jgi:hypothetical protein
MGTVLQSAQPTDSLTAFSDHERVDAWAPSSSLLFSNPQLVLHTFRKVSHLKEIHDHKVHQRVGVVECVVKVAAQLRLYGARLSSTWTD